MQVTTETRPYEVKERFKIEKKAVRLEVQRQAPEKQEKTKPQAKALIAPVAWLTVCAMGLFISQRSGGIYFDKILICSIIIGCIIFFKAKDGLAD